MDYDDDFVNYITDMLQDFGEIEARKMFGDYGIYNNGYFFAILAGDRLFLKADDESRHLFEKQNLEKFSYMKQGKECFLSYYAVPPEAIDDIDMLFEWAEIGYQAAIRANTKKVNL